MPLLTSTQLLLAPCSFCQRKPGFFANGKTFLLLCTRKKRNRDFKFWSYFNYFYWN